ncbi:MAG: TlpA family protein disulfide reductase, partial [Fidelibacterota bacterium]
MIDAKKIGLVGGGILLLLIAGITLTNNPAGNGGNRVASVFVPDSGPFVGSRAPDFKLKGTNGTVISLSDFQGKVVIVNFWATWCAPCREEIPGFVKLQERYRDDVVIVGISMDQDGPRVVPPFVEKFGINYPV